MAEMEQQIATLGKLVTELAAKDREREQRLTKLEDSLRSHQPAALPAKLETAAR